MNRRKHPKLTVPLTAVLCVFILHAAAAAVHAEVLSDEEAQTTELIVMIKSRLGIGAGIIFGSRDDRIYIATSNHVVRRGSKEASDIQVALKSLPGQWFEAALTNHYDAAPEVDLAVLSLKNLEQYGINACSLPFRRLGDTDALKRGQAVYPVGYPNGAPWAMPITPDRIAQVVGQQITFQSAFISNGHSGGGLLNEHGDLIGMVRADQPPFGIAVNFGSILKSLRQWGYKVQLHTKPAIEGRTLLHLAVQQGDIDEARKLLEDCFDPNRPDIRGWTPLHLAASDAQPKMVQLLLESGANVNIEDRYINKATPLYYAVRKGNLDIVKLLLMGGAEISSSILIRAFDHSEILDTLLAKRPALNSSLLSDAVFRAVEKGRSDIVERLLNQSMDADWSSEWLQEMLCLAASHGHVKTAAVLLSHGAVVNNRHAKHDQMNPLHIAARKGNLKLVKLLIAEGAEIDAESGDGRTALYYALDWLYSPDTAHLKIAHALLKAGAQLKAMRGAEKAFFIKGIERKNLELTKLLLTHGLDPNDFKGYYLSDYPIGAACSIMPEEYALEFVHLLVSHGADVNINIGQGVYKCDIPLHCAIGDRKAEVAKLLIESGADVNVSSEYYSYKKPLHLAALEGMYQIVQSLLAHGAKVNACDGHRNTPLFYAADSNHADIVRILLTNGADPNAGQPLTLASRNGYLDIAEILINAGADVNAGKDSGNYPLLEAAINGNEAMIRLLIDAGANAANTRYSTLSVIKGENTVSIAKLLIKAGAELEAQEGMDDHTPLHLAVLSKQVSLAAYLLEAGADVNAKDRNGNTPLHLAANDQEGAAMARVLIDAGADLKAVNKNNETALTVAESIGSDVYDVLVKAGR